MITHNETCPWCGVPQIHDPQDFLGDIERIGDRNDNTFINTVYIDCDRCRRGIIVKYKIKIDVSMEEDNIPSRTNKY